jgi:hypothetical protein
MESFYPSDRVVAVNTNHAKAICGASGPSHICYTFPDGTLCEGKVYHVASVTSSRDGHQGLMLTGLRIFWDKEQIPWNSSRFRKIKSSGSICKVREENPDYR